ncbi:hypothetical protein [Azospirillum canadense]|uniref:hypothetical protein n=1 Tax=Azospirillum canadense TaxID=403962 RepID=UPI002226599F|nr:hypothetical protein [Azospirillum canadense]MCW2238583.1 hypothetical protein [Azospirillum canadense]
MTHMIVQFDTGLTTHLRAWAWLDVGGRQRRLIGWSIEDGAWLVSEPVTTVATSRPAEPPGWAVTANNHRYLLTQPGLPQEDEPLTVIDRLRTTGGLEARAVIQIVPWQAAAQAAVPPWAARRSA